MHSRTGADRQLAAEQISLVRVNEKGEQVYVDDATRRKERTNLETWVKANCSHDQNTEALRAACFGHGRAKNGALRAPFFVPNWSAEKLGRPRALRS
jgi:hypothetical protein